MTTATVKIVKLTVMTCRAGGDKVVAFVELPSPIVTVAEPLSMTFEASAGFGESFCKTNFPGVPVKVVDMSRF